MPSGKIHDSIANRVFGVIPVDLNAEMDKAAKALGSRHRLIGHDDKAIERIAQLYKDRYPLDKLNQPLSYYLAKLHLTCDFCPAHPERDTPMPIEGEATEVSESDRKINSLYAELSLKNAKINYLNQYIWLVEDSLHEKELDILKLSHFSEEISTELMTWTLLHGQAYGMNVEGLKEFLTSDSKAQAAVKIVLRAILDILNKWEIQGDVLKKVGIIPRKEMENHKQ